MLSKTVVIFSELSFSKYVVSKSFQKVPLSLMFFRGEGAPRPIIPPNDGLRAEEPLQISLGKNCCFLCLACVLSFERLRRRRFRPDFDLRRTLPT